MNEHTVIFGNAHCEGLPRRGWFIGHFMETDDLRTTEALEVKWGVHKAGDRRSQWSTDQQTITLSILIKGRFRLQFPDREHVLANEGDYVLWDAGVAHTWVAENDSTVLTVRYPSTSANS
ncbi:MAG TPA: signal peptidase I [Crinalium sp.]|jgi:quercetin dioxygenase-like cupin family protein